MKKSILVINTPKKCEECDLCKNYKRVQHAWGNPDTYEVHCMGIGNITLKEVPREGVPDWCPLRKIPEKYKYADTNFERGYNTCIDDIIGEYE